MTVKNYQFISDAGHGWLKVPFNHVQKLGIIKEISDCSYVSKDGLYIYLEEDCDCPFYLKKAGLLNDDGKLDLEKVNVTTTRSNQYSRIRNLNRIN